MMSSLLFKRNNTYYLRLYLPQDFAPYFSRKEIWESLKNKELQVCQDYYIEAALFHRAAFSTYTEWHVY